MLVDFEVCFLRLKRTAVVSAGARAAGWAGEAGSNHGGVVWLQYEPFVRGQCYVMCYVSKLGLEYLEYFIHTRLVKIPQPTTAVVEVWKSNNEQINKSLLLVIK